MEKFRITITDLETGVTKIDEKTDCIIGAYNKNDGTVSALSFANCKTIDLACTIQGTQVVIKELFKKRSKLKRLLRRSGLFKKYEVTERTEKSGTAKEETQCRNSGN